MFKFWNQKIESAVFLRSVAPKPKQPQSTPATSPSHHHLRFPSNHVNNLNLPPASSKLPSHTPPFTLPPPSSHPPPTPLSKNARIILRSSPLHLPRTFLHPPHRIEGHLLWHLLWLFINHVCLVRFCRVKRFIS